MEVVIGGTFDRLHKGHEALISKAFEIGDFVRIGVTSDAYVKKTKEDWIRVQPVWERVDGVKKFLAAKGWLDRAEVTVIEDNISSPAAELPGLDAIVVSQDTVAGAKEINAARIRRGLRPLAISIIPTVNVGGKPVSSSAIRGGGPRRGQGAFEYILLLGGILLIVVFIGGVLRTSYGTAGGQINDTIAAAMRLNVITPTPTPEATPDPGCDDLRPRCFNVPDAKARGCYSHGNLCGPATQDVFCWACPTVTPAPCPGGYAHEKCIAGYPPKYCAFGAINDNCQKCGCPTGQSCTNIGLCAVPGGATAEATALPTIPTPIPSPAKKPVPPAKPPSGDAFASVSLALDAFSSSMLGIGTSITQFVLGIGTYAWVIVLAALLILMAVLVFFLSRTKK